MRNAAVSDDLPAPPAAPDVLSRHFLSLQILAVVLVGALLYGHTLRVPWYLDDLTGIHGSGTVHNLGEAFSALFTHRGFSRLTLALNYRFGELDPLGYHLVNIAIHLAAACLVLFLLRRVFSRQRWYPLLGALLFVAHPLQTQAVTYVIQRMASLSALCFLLSLYLFVRGRELLAAAVPFRSPRQLACYLGALLAGVLAILAKENAIVLPLALLLFARFFLPETATRWRSLLIAIAPFGLASVVFTILFFVAPLLTGAIALDRLADNAGLVGLQGNSSLHYLVTEFSVLWIYIRLLFLPWGQAFDYGYPVSRALVTLQSVAGLLGLAALLVLAVRLRRRQPAISAGILWFFLTLAVESSVIPLDPLFEHRLYLPGFGFAMLLPALLDLLPRPALRHGVLVGFLLVMAILTWRRNALWNDPIALYEDNLRQTPHNERVCKDLAIAYLAAQRPQAAAPLLERTLQLNPRILVPYLRLPGIYIYLGRLDDADRVLRDGLRYFPEESALHVSMGRLLSKRGDAIEAERFLRKGIDLDATSAEAHQLLARELQRQGRSGEAAQEREVARKLEQ